MKLGSEKGHLRSSNRLLSRAGSIFLRMIGPFLRGYDTGSAVLGIHHLNTFSKDISDILLKDWEASRVFERNRNASF